MRKSRFIADLKGLGANDRFESAFLVRAKEVRQKKSGDPFLSLQLADRTGWLDSKMWDNVRAVAETFRVGDFVAVRGKMQVFNGRHQIIAHKLTPLPEEDVFLGDFVPHTDCDVEEMYAGLVQAVRGFADPHLKRLMLSIFEDEEFARLYKRAPAAQAMHHARIGGLLEHVWSLLRLSQLVASHYDDIDADLLACGVLMHDAGKVFELSADRAFGYTDKGKLLGHIAMGASWLERRCDELEGFPPRLKTLLLHLVLSHHGRMEYGSPVRPQIPEALALHMIDDLDAKLEIMRAATGELPAGEIWTPFVKGMQRQVLDKAAFLADGLGARPADGAAARRKPRPARKAGPGRPGRSRSRSDGRAAKAPADGAPGGRKRKRGPRRRRIQADAQPGPAARQPAQEPPPAPKVVRPPAAEERLDPPALPFATLEDV